MVPRQKSVREIRLLFFYFLYIFRIYIAESGGIISANSTAGSVNCPNAISFLNSCPMLSRNDCIVMAQWRHFHTHFSWPAAGYGSFAFCLWHYITFGSVPPQMVQQTRLCEGDAVWRHFCLEGIRQWVCFCFCFQSRRDKLNKILQSTLSVMFLF